MHILKCEKCFSVAFKVCLMLTSSVSKYRSRIEKCIEFNIKFMIDAPRTVKVDFLAVFYEFFGVLV